MFTRPGSSTVENTTQSVTLWPGPKFRWSSEVLSYIQKMVNQWLTHNGLLGRSSDGSVGKVLWIDGDFWCDPGHPSHFESLSCHHCSPPNLSSAPWWPGFSLLVFIPQFTQCVFFVSFCLIICYSTVLHTHMSTHRDIDTELQRHFLQRPSLMGPLIFLSQHSSDPPVVKILQFLVGEIAVVWWSLDSLDHHDLKTMHWIHWRSDDWVTLWLWLT